MSCTRSLPPAVEAEQRAAVLREAVLRRSVADRERMQRQLAHLVNVSQKPGIGVRVLPSEVGPHPASAAGSFVILDFPSVGSRPPEPTTVYSENLTGALYLDKLGEVATYADVWELLGGLVLGQRESEDLIGKILKESADD